MLDYCTYLIQCTYVCTFFLLCIEYIHIYCIMSTIDHFFDDWKISNETWKISLVLLMKNGRFHGQVATLM